MKTYWVSGGAFLTSTLDESDQLYALAAIPPGKEPSIPPGQKIGWAPEPV